MPLDDNKNHPSSNAPNIESGLGFMQFVLLSRIKLHFGEIQELKIDPPSVFDDESPYSKFIVKNEPSIEEYTIILLALAPHTWPGLIANLISDVLPSNSDLPEFGGTKGNNHRSIIPTGETAQFILAGNDIEKRLAIQRLFSNEHWFYKKSILHLESVPNGEPVMSGKIILDPEVLELLTVGVVSKPRFSTEFPAELIETEMDWSDLVLHPNTKRQIHEIEDWIKFNPIVMQDWGMGKKLKPGYRALFYGPPGTGKTLTTCLLGKYTGKDVFRIDLSRVVSKYIGETEKNLSRLFDKAEHKNWILFFDEADALFGKRTDIRDAHDKYANQETAYLLQRVEAYNGLVILATNQRAHIDEAFSRRFQAIIHFPIPRPEERIAIWEKAFPSQLHIAEDINWQQIASRYELSGAGIMNVAQHCAFAALSDKTNRVDIKKIEAAVLREYVKEGKIV